MRDVAFNILDFDLGPLVYNRVSYAVLVNHNFVVSQVSRELSEQLMSCVCLRLDLVILKNWLAAITSLLDGVHECFTNVIEGMAIMSKKSKAVLKERHNYNIILLDNSRITKVLNQTHQESSIPFHISFTILDPT